MGSCSSRHRSVQPISVLNLNSDPQADSAHATQTAQRQKSTSNATRSSKTSFGKWNMKVDASLSTSFAHPTVADPAIAGLLQRLTGIDIFRYPVVMAQIQFKSKRPEQHRAPFLEDPTILWGDLEVRQQVPQFLPKKITTPQMSVFAILETDSPTSTSVQLQGQIDGEKVLIMSSLDTTRSEIEVHQKLCAYMKVKTLNTSLCWACGENLPQCFDEANSPGRMNNVDMRSRRRSRSDRKFRTASWVNDDLNRESTTTDSVFLSSRDLPPLRRLSINSHSTIAQAGSLANSPVRPSSRSSREEPHFASPQQHQQQLQPTQQVVLEKIQQPHNPKKKVRRPTPIITKATREIAGKKNGMLVCFEDDEEIVLQEPSRNKGYLSGISVDRKRLPAIEGESRPTSADHHNEAAASPKFNCDPVIEHSERETEDEISDQES